MEMKDEDAILLSQIVTGGKNAPFVYETTSEIAGNTASSLNGLLSEN